MLKRRTVIVLGAGASREAKLPCGDDLALKISGKLDMRIDGARFTGSGDAALFDLFWNTYRRDINKYLHAARIVRDGIHLSPSIDNFLDLHRANGHMTHLAKATIVKCILDAERESALWFDPSNPDNSINFPSLHATWFAKFMKLLGKNVSGDIAPTLFDNVSFIVFNYDRCLEHFLHHAVKRLYAIDDKTAISICAKLDIDHPYGLVAPLRIDAGPGVPFGKNDVNCIELADNIKTFTEQAESDTLASMRKKLEAADCIIFLGCAFHEPNMVMLSKGNNKIQPVVYGTTFGFSTDDAYNIQSEITTLYRPATLHLRNVKCAELFDTFSRSIAG